MLEGALRKTHVAWSDIAIFKTREYTARSFPSVPMFFVQRPTAWVITRQGKQHQLKGIRSEELLHELNLAVDEYRAKGRVDLARFSDEAWKPFLLQ